MSTSWLRPLGAGRGTRTLLALPHAGGNYAGLRNLATALSPEVDVVAVQYPGRLDRVLEPPLTSITESSERVATEYGAPCGKLVVLGTSMGALIAFETVRRLQARGVPVDLLIVAGIPSPARIGRRPARSEQDDMEMVAQMIAIGGASPDVANYPEVLRLLLPVLRAEYRAVESYHPEDGAQVDCPILSVVGDADPWVSMEDAADWSAMTSHDCTAQEVVGGHLLAESAPQRLGELLRRQVCTE